MLELTIDDKAVFSVATDNGETLLNGSKVSPDISVQPNGLISILSNGKSYTGLIEQVDMASKTVTVVVNGRRFTSAIKEPLDLLLSNMGLDLKAMQKAEPVKAPMPGLVLKVLVTPGQKIEKGDGLVILEAMKMENVLKATAPATVKSINVSERTAVEKGTILIELE